MTAAVSDGQADGAIALQDRAFDAVWHVPTLALSALLLLTNLSSADGPGSGISRLLLVLGFVAITGVVVLAAATGRHHARPRVRALIACNGLLAGFLMALAAPPENADLTMLLLAGPMAWLGFEFGVRGAVAGIMAAVVVALTLRLVDGVGVDTAALAILGVFLVGMTLVAAAMGRRLGRANDTFRHRDAELTEALGLAESRLELLSGAMESIDAGVTILQPGVAPIRNERADAMARHAGTNWDLPGAPADRVYSEDGLSPVPTSEQAATRAARGDEFDGLVHRIGEPGDQVAVVLSSRHLITETGEPIGTVLAAFEATRMLDAITTREEFVATVSHELRTPLTAITASLELLYEITDVATDDDAAGDRLRLLAACVRNAGLLNARIAELMASTAATDTPLQLRATDVTELVRVSLAKHDTDLSQAALRMELDLPEPVVAEIDPVRWEQVIDNLVSNAIKYTPGAGDITVSLHRRGDSFTLTVADTGFGMTPDEVRQACDRFYRAPNARSATAKGLGIGLSLVKVIAARHHGTLDIESRSREGTTVTISVPLSSPAFSDA